MFGLCNRQYLILQKGRKRLYQEMVSFLILVARNSGKTEIGVFYKQGKRPQLKISGQIVPN